MRIRVSIKEEEGKLNIYLEENQPFNVTYVQNGVPIMLSTEPLLNYTFVSKGSKILTISDGDHILINNQFTPWNFKRIYEGRWEATHNSFKRKFIKSGNQYILAATSGAARNGILHNVKTTAEDQNKIGA